MVIMELGQAMADALKSKYGIEEDAELRKIYTTNTMWVLSKENYDHVIFEAWYNSGDTIYIGICNGIIYQRVSPDAD